MTTDTATASTGPLSGIRIVDLTSVIMGPYATQILADLGADVITVEEPGGTLNRMMSPGPHPQLSGIALNLLRNKRNVILDLKDDTGREAFRALVATADVLVTNLRPRTLERLKLSYADLVEAHPELIYCQAQGWPSDSPRADAPAYDDIIQAATGLPDASRIAEGTPRFAPTIVADKVCGMVIAYGVTAALVHRGRTGTGQHIEVPMSDVMTGFVLVEHAAARTARPAQGPAGYRRILNSGRRPQRTLDGWISVLPYTRQNYLDLFRIGGRPELGADERIRGARSRVEHAGALYELVAEVVATRNTADWLMECAEHGIPATAVATLDELVDDLPEAEHPVAGAYAVLPQPVRFGCSSGPTVRRPAALPGEHTDEVFRELGLPPRTVDALVARSQSPSSARRPPRPPEEPT